MERGGREEGEGEGRGGEVRVDERAGKGGAE